MTVGVRLLQGLPPYGPLATAFPSEWGRLGREGTVVEFMTEAGSWVANFQPGLGGLEFAQLTPTGATQLSSPRVIYGWSIQLGARQNVCSPLSTRPSMFATPTVGCSAGKASLSPVSDREESCGTPGDCRGMVSINSESFMHR